MTVLTDTERKGLEKSVLDAHRKAEAGAFNALNYLGVEADKKPFHLSDAEAELRRRLRSEMRRLGSYDVLISSVAYEQWHRMLFARFLLENDLLIHPKFKVPVSFSDITEIADEKGSEAWEVAAEFASHMLPGIFRQDDPFLMVKFSPEDRIALQGVLDGISSESFLAEDALGWTYQFWQSEKKKEVNDSERKIEGYDICAVTQLFTEPYMVKFLLENTLGAWWLSLHPDSGLKSEWEFYRSEVEHDFSGWPSYINELKILDPCCGSGHFLVRAFHMLLSMRREKGEENEAAISAIISKNLHGLELDPRCIQIATFALALEAWKEGFSPTDSYLPVPNLACTGIPIKAEKDDWLKLAGGDGMLESALENYYDLFKNADSLGSLIQLDNQSSSGTDKHSSVNQTLIDQKTLMEKLEQALKKETAAGDPVAETFGETANAIMKAAHLLNCKYDYVVTNVPYLTRGKQSDILKDFCESNYPLSKNDIATVFLERCLSFTSIRGKVSIVLPQNWLFQPRYENIRKKLIKSEKWDILAKLGPGAFETISGEVVKAILMNIEHGSISNEHLLSGIDVSNRKNASDKAIGLLSDDIKKIQQIKQLENPSSLISFESLNKINLLGKYATCIEGLSTGDSDRFIKKYWEVYPKDKNWELFIQNVNENMNYGGRENILFWENGKGALQRFPNSHNFPSNTMNGFQVLGNKGLRITQMQNPKVTIYTGEIFGKSAGTLVLEDNSLLTAVLSYCNSDLFSKEVNIINQSLYKPVGTFLKVPFDLEYWQKVAAEKYPDGLPEPYSDDPTQWLFHGHPKPSESPLHVAVARLLGYRWLAETDTEMELSSEARDWIKESEKLLSFADDDGIVCIPSVRGEGRMDERVREVLKAAFGSEWSARHEEKMLADLGYVKKDGSLKGDLEKFLRDEFFKSHCKLFHNRPFIWHIWDGEKDGFSVLVNYHKLDRRNLERLIYSYLGPWISQQEREKADNKAGAEKRLVAAKELKRRLELILEGEAPYDIYIRWKPLHEQAVGWEPDINDGVRLNIRPFVEAEVLRSKITAIKWGKDRGKDAVPNCSGTVERHNDLHFTLEEKWKARKEAE
ncbi:BREX-1 system adenine-specific DNA-methyltransferase PglX [Methanoplanus endosymbiosus]|uniref:site-specific DNA-methyltransferase (adenine-specific) n=1 Tax=Methanoplanus endosymbiosus TaxID=33865 RepID=A0A9E7THA6_9EURY|nr:BREX-1 system adenine-specific DNA-methyltransferase PglX [Methanoplanus endosymbiosus]UUX92487.1 BREX-1 system adenine-specific DNA-methyltransferase PglX [Methanoplanus endosymbiosus]